MTIEEAIKHAEEVAEEQIEKAKEFHQAQVNKCEVFPFAEMDYTYENKCKQCAEEHRQLAEWLKELKAYKEQTDGDLIIISRQTVEDAIAETIVNGESLGYGVAYDILSGLPQITPLEQTDGDLISHSDLLCEDCRTCNKWSECECGEKGHKNGTSIGYSIGECKDYELCEDCISRQAVLDLVADYDFSMWQVIKGIHALPSFTQHELPSAEKTTINPEKTTITDGNLISCLNGWNKVYKDILEDSRKMPSAEQTDRIITELEKIKTEIQGLIDFEESCCGNTTLGYQCLGVIKDKISELKGESEDEE